MYRRHLLFMWLWQMFALGLHNIRPMGCFLQPARAFTTAENIAKAWTRISNCRSKISSILQWNLHMKNEIDFCGPRQTYVDNLALRAFWVVQAWLTQQMITEVPHAYQLLSKLPSCQPSQFISHWLNLSGCQTKNVYLNVTNLRQKLKLKNHLTGHVLFKIWSCAWCGPQNFSLYEPWVAHPGAMTISKSQGW